MKNINFKIINLLLFFIIVFTFTSNEQSYAHLIKGKEHKIFGKPHKPLTCIPFEERHQFKRIWCKDKMKNHSLCKEDIHCVLIKLSEQEQTIEQQEQENKDLEKKLGDMTVCSDITFSHKTSKKSKVYRKPDTKSSLVQELNKGEELLFISPSSKNKKWYFVLTRKDNSCNSGYIAQKFVVKKESDDEDIKITKEVKNVDKSKLISIISPAWTKEGKLIELNASGVQTIRGWVDESKIDEIIVDEKVRAIQSDSTFSFNVFVKNDTKEIRITGNKNGKKVKSLIFKIRVGS